MRSRPSEQALPRPETLARSLGQLDPARHTGASAWRVLTWVSKTRPRRCGAPAAAPRLVQPNKEVLARIPEQSAGPHLETLSASATTSNSRAAISHAAETVGEERDVPGAP